MGYAIQKTFGKDITRSTISESEKLSLSDRGGTASLKSDKITDLKTILDKLKNSPFQFEGRMRVRRFKLKPK